MPKHRLILMVSILFIITSICPLYATTIYDLSPDDNYVIGLNTDRIERNIAVDELYGEAFLKPYNSHDGFGIANENGNYFDTRFVLEDIGPWTFTFNVTNTGPYTWSDYHFEFWNSDFTTRIPLLPLGPPPTSDIFANAAQEDVFVEYWAPGLVAPGATVQMSFAIIIDTVGQLDFGLRQVATTVPEPTTAILFGIGLLGLAGISRRKL